MPSGQKNGKRAPEESWSSYVERRLDSLDLKIKLLVVAVVAPKAFGAELSEAIPAVVRLFS